MMVIKTPFASENNTFAQKSNASSDCNVEPSSALETPKELSTRISVPVSTIRGLIKSGRLAHVYLGQAKRNPKIPIGAWENFLAQNTVTPSVSGEQQEPEKEC